MNFMNILILFFYLLIRLQNSPARVIQGNTMTLLAYRMHDILQFHYCAIELPQALQCNKPKLIIMY